MYRVEALCVDPPPRAELALDAADLTAEEFAAETNVEDAAVSANTKKRTIVLLFRSQRHHHARLRLR